MSEDGAVASCCWALVTATIVLGLAFGGDPDFMDAIVALLGRLP